MDPKPQMNELQTLVHPVKMNPGSTLDRPLPADSVEKIASSVATAFFVSELSALFGSTQPADRQSWCAQAAT